MIKPGRILRIRALSWVNPYPVYSNLLRWSVICVAVLLLVAGAMMVSYNLFYDGKMFPGVAVLSIDVGGCTEAEARDLVSSRLHSYAKGALTAQYGGQEWTVTPEEFGLRYDVDKMVEDGYAIGREGNVAEQFVIRALALTRGQSARPAVWFEKQAQENVLNETAAAVDRPVRDAEMGVDPNGAIRISSSQTGLKVNPAATVEKFEASFVPLSTNKLSLIVDETKPQVVEADLAKTQATAQKIVGEALTLKLGGKSWSASEKDLLGMLRFSKNAGGGEKVKAQLDNTLLAEYLKRIAAETNNEPKDAYLEYKNGKVNLVPGEDGIVLDVDANVAAINSQAVSDARTLTLVQKTQKPAIVDGSLLEAKAAAEKMIAEPFILKYGELAWTLTPSQLGGMLAFEKEQTAQGGGTRVVATFDKARFTKFLEPINDRIGKPAKDARFRFKDGQLSIASDSVDGLTVDPDATMQSVVTEARQGRRTASISMEVEKPKVQSSDKDKIVIKDLLKEASTSYAGSIWARAKNVELAASRLDGVIIPPGEVFSMNRALGPTSVATGYKIAYGITVSGSVPLTVESIAGGICQVATTLYHAAFWTGLPIVERHEHLYWIPRYGQPPLGMKGLDATVDDPGVDLQFKNTTGNWLAIQSRTDGSNVYFSIYGTKPGWEVKADGPHISNYVPTDQTWVEQEDPTKPWGWELNVEHAEDGFTAVINRTVLKDGQVIDEYKSVSRYLPSRNVTLIGTQGRPEPEPTPTPEPKPGENPGAVGPGTPTPTPGPGTPTATPGKPAPGTPTPTPQKP